uniref:Polysaccharide biosynthesis protein C-terminal domain-containing protein n=1 Tax=Odontella aurita TaxID=265563 RepID=A0A7S4ITB3_9STRA|mmetsp:Transcript_3006/g.7836  ORF Transcript_3006/g.7836 Transcript_3006/m.7836 type:complete len:683 (+) Transcript_3006:237-2285(+)|eukprot:CAMPEP_0113560406 /NCGR_PEP_ID=MMETSP0015_2-20120614/19413_1 /TAXON_ID=2838 /ORGANISM="Odontella" /LENGTH=682 /DNA_ID=CAMNT_0000462107 /DNA_START=230 /DNA_END=2278 /DNA_ORIENTATION=+ /assembly_acc=CAM_ASM_000160
MAALLLLLSVAHHAAAFVPNGVQMPPASGAGHNGRASPLITNVLEQTGRLYDKQRYMSTEEIMFKDIAPGTILEDADGIGEVLNQEFSDSVPLTVNDLLRDDATTLASSNEEIAKQILDSLPTEPLEHANVFPDDLIKSERVVPDAPGFRQIMRFAIPAIGVWLCSPILSLIDTSSVGLLAGTAQQAALNPAVAVTDYATLLVAFMYTATTNLVATAQEKEKNCEEGKPLTTKALITSLQLSGIVGTALGACLIVFTKMLLRTIIGNDSINPEVFTAAMKYVRIRALGMPAAVLIGSAQSASLGMQDIKSPLYVLVAAAIVNLIGDMLFVGSSSPWIGGAAGAAWATVFSQYAALAMFLKWFVSKPSSQKKEKAEKLNISDAILELTGDSNDGVPRRRQFRASVKNIISSSSARRSKVISNKKEERNAAPVFSTRGFLHGRFRKRDLVSLPEKETALKFWPYVVPVTTTSVGRVSSYAAMSHVVSSALGTISMAANQVILSLFYCLTPLADSLNLTAQSFVPSLFAKRTERAGADALKKTTGNFIKAGGIFGALMVAAVACIPIFSKFFTADPIVVAQVNSAVPYLAGTFAVHGAICASEGLLLGQKDLGFLGKAYAVFFAAVPFFMLRIKRAALSGIPNVGLSSVWQVFMTYQFVRTILFILRIKQIEAKTEKNVIAGAYE